ncbi:MAG: hypothetical protein PHR20_09200 [Bacteroidales bacterium]|nr:hypothetical protein [Bacteroidales bacterium]
MENKGIIKNLQLYKVQDLFGDKEEDRYYTIKDNGAYRFCFECEEKREETQKFTFFADFLFQTYNDIKVLYIEVASSNYEFDIDSKTNCLEIIKHTIRKQIEDFDNRDCLFDKQSLYYATQVYPLIHETENLFREYVNDVFVKTFGPNWWDGYVARGIREKCKEKIKDTRSNVTAYIDINPNLLSLEFMQLKELAETKLYKWTPKFDKRIEDRLNNQSEADLLNLLHEQTSVKFDLWELYFGKFLPPDFLTMYSRLEKKRNHIAHNKLLDWESYIKTIEICNYIKQSLATAYSKYLCSKPSEEEEQKIEEFNMFVAYQERECEKEVATSETGVKVCSVEEILAIFNEALYNLYDAISDYFSDRNDLDFSNFFEISNADSESQVFSIYYRIDGRKIEIKANVEIVETAGTTSVINITVLDEETTMVTKITFVNGEYEYSFDQGCYLPLVSDELNVEEVKASIDSINSFIENQFINLKEEAALQEHLAVMGKAESIIESDIYCCECDEPYICINSDIAPIGTCLNCGAKNVVIYCYNCGEPVEAVSKEDYSDEDKNEFCNYCKSKMYDDD